jgi:hypothetical protein
LRPDHRRQAAEGQRQDDDHPGATRPAPVPGVRAGAYGRGLDLVVAGRTTGICRAGRSRLDDLAGDRSRRRGRPGRRSGCRLGRRSGCRLTGGPRSRHGGWRTRIRRTRSRRRSDRHDRPLARRGGPCRLAGRCRRRGCGRLGRGRNRRRRRLRSVTGWRPRGGRRHGADQGRRGSRRRADRGDVVIRSGRRYESRRQRNRRENQVQEPHGDDEACALSGCHDVQWAPCASSESAVRTARW